MATLAVKGKWPLNQTSEISGIKLIRGVCWKTSDFCGRTRRKKTPQPRAKKDSSSSPWGQLVDLIWKLVSW